MILTNLERLIVDDYCPNLEKALTYLCANKTKIFPQAVGTFQADPNFFYIIQEYCTNAPPSAPRWESHQKYIDIQLILEGEEAIDTLDIKYLNIAETYNPDKDVIFYEETTGASRIVLRKGDFAVFFPEDGHKPALIGPSGNSNVKKCLFKIAVEH
ncbi:MAG: YhcH/YjgK/YiaL family protein [Brevinemataceae bacterium]